MTTYDAGVPRSRREVDEDQLNLLLDELTHRRPVDAQNLDPALVHTATSVLSVGGAWGTTGVDAGDADRLWGSLVDAPDEREVAGGRGRGSVVGLVAPWPRLSPERVPVWGVRLLSVVAAVLLVAVTASHYGEVPGGRSTTTAMAAGAPGVTPTRVAAPATCGPTVAASVTRSPVDDRGTRSVTPSSTFDRTPGMRCGGDRTLR